MFIYLFIYLFIYFWLLWVFVAARELFLVAVRGGYSLLRCPGFSLQWFLLLWSTGCRAQAQYLRHMGSVPVAGRLSSCGSQTLECRLSSCGTQAQ